MDCFHLHWENLHAHKDGSITMITKQTVNLTVSWSTYTRGWGGVEYKLLLHLLQINTK